jgi:hypothetical protein
MTTNSFHTRVHQIINLDKAVKSTKLKIKVLIEHFKSIAFINGSHPYNNLTGEDHATAFDLYDALEIFEASLRAHSIFREVPSLT